MEQNIPQEPESREWLDMDAMAAIYPFPRATLYSWRHQGKGPPSVRRVAGSSIAEAMSKDGSRSKWPQSEAAGAGGRDEPQKQHDTGGNRCQCQSQALLDQERLYIRVDGLRRPTDCRRNHQSG